ncbi:shikimate dehydrogenase [Helicovermis profundi]|uniref:Shikimate dehydrogenase (NADP(+)) n=1 Tax=Helicovermis profundi TaxID=3065157 RepID=A0AAU9ER66_9FIRM|nr:shikimate dehydrogenase [Clostridia bacterium S502]
MDSKTEMISLLGHPVSHSFSPIIHNKILAEYSINAFYNALDILPSDLNVAIMGLKACNIKGMNVTIPHKEKIVKLLDCVSEEASKIGSVNTIVNESGKLKGYNTDYIGFINSLIINNIEYKKKKVALLGYGGAATAILYALNENLCDCHIFVRNIEKTKSKIDQLKYELFTGVNIKPLEEFDLTAYSYDIVINSTPLGMGELIDISPVSLKNANVNCQVVDIIYNPSETKFLKEAKKYNLKYINGIDMLIEQALESFFMWTGIRADRNVVILELKKLNILF